MSLADTVIKVRIDSATKRQAVMILDSLGISLSESVRQLLRHICDQRNLPMEVVSPKRRKLRRKTVSTLSGLPSIGIPTAASVLSSLPLGRQQQQHPQ